MERGQEVDQFNAKPAACTERGCARMHFVHRFPIFWVPSAFLVLSGIVVILL